ncbi:GTP-binding protein, chloroplastic [Ananas comosus]|uniref:GTP-binding protein, chloroplastic n=1 Tax=Ananas comosus TaxID=4615 RepID=A0A199UG14_ANACO|nr:GTP-binding protein, chloroplastic [Ananas comosus]
MLRTLALLPRLRSRTLLLRPFHLLSPSPAPSPSPLLAHSSFSTSSRRRKRKEGDEEDDDGDRGGGGLGLFVLGRDPTRPPRLFVVQPRLRPDALLDSKLAEALNLANSLEEPRDGFYDSDFASKDLPPHLVVQNPAARSARAHADTYFGPGTVENIKCHIKALESEEQNGIDAVFVNAILSGIQQRNLEASLYNSFFGSLVEMLEIGYVAWGKPVLDRVGLIIEIFNAHAETKEGKLQSELAALMYKRTRLVRVRGPGGRLTFGLSGEAEVVSARGRGSGGRGFISGAGETELQLQRRRIQERRNSLLEQIEEVRRTRALQRSARKRHGSSCGQGLATVAVVGYTNAGKSTLVSALSDCDLYSDDRLFATVDPRLRSVVLPSGYPSQLTYRRHLKKRKAILSDTVGFISDLPVQLVEAFHATLEEVVEADLLVHVLDASAPNLEEHRSTVLQVLQQIGVPEDKIENMIEVWNKIDLLEENNGANEFAEEDECLVEGEEGEEDEETFPEVDDDMATELSSGEVIDGNRNDDMASMRSSEEDVEDLDDMASGLSATEEHMGNFDEQVSESESTKQWEVRTESTKSGCHVRTSAVTGIGLQELLSLIDEKLNEQKPVVQRSFGPFDRKWRPSYAEHDEKVAEQFGEMVDGTEK